MTEHPKDKKGIWPGELVSKESMLPYIKKAFSREMLGGKMHFALAYPGLVKSAEKLFTVRLCRYDSIKEPVCIQAAFDGLLSKRDFNDGDWFIGSYNSGCEVPERNKIVYGGLSVVFHLHHIRLHYCRFNCGKPEVNIYYHIPRKSDSILCRMMQILDMIIRENNTDRETRCRPLLEALGEQLCCELDKKNQQDSFPNIVFLKIKGYMDHNFTGFINCTSVCDALNINRSYGSTVFKDDFGISMADYLLKLRIDAAKYLLLSEQKLKIQEIASYCAFSDTGYFIRVFRQQTGKTPGEFRRCSTTFQQESH